jgi:hypothetical protein
MLKFFFRIVLFLFGIFMVYFFGRDVVNPIRYRFAGEQVEGRISGFLLRRSKTVVTEPDGHGRGGKSKARRPVFMYPTRAGGTDSLEGRSGMPTFFTFTNYELNERVPVVFATGHPEKAYIFGWQIIGFSALATLLGLYAIRMGALGKD